MWTILRQSLERGWKSILGWGLALSALGAFILGFTDTVVDQRESLEVLFQSYPPEMLAIFGDTATMLTPEGFINLEFYQFLPLVLGIPMMVAASGLLAADEESGVMDLVLAHPVSRWRLFAGRVLGQVIYISAILLICWIGFVLRQPGTRLTYTWLELALPLFSTGAMLLFFCALALLLSMLLPSRRMAASVGGLVLVASFFLPAFGRLDETLADWVWLSPLHYYQGGTALSGLNGEWLAGLLVGAILMGGLAGWRFARRDIRVAGEGSLGWLPRRWSKT